MKFNGKVFLTLISSLIFLFCLNGEALAKKRHHSTPAATESFSPAIYGTTELNAEINRVVSNVSPSLNVGIHIKSMRHGDTLYTRSANQLYVPASILKVFTAEAALLYMGPNYKFPTVFTTDAKTINNGVLEGNLYLVHSGDPTLTYYDLAALIAMLKAKQITRITGNIYIDTSAYDQEIYGPGWLSNDTRFCYAAPISASIINHNCMVLQVSPAKNVGSRANVYGDKHHYISGVQNDVMTKPKGTRSCTVHLGTEQGGITLSGCMPKGRSTQGVSAVVTNIVHYNKSLIQSLFQRYGIQVGGAILPGVAPNKLPVVASHESKALKDLISEMLKKSDNIIAGSLFKKMGELSTRAPGSWENGSAAVKQILRQKAGVDTGQMNVLDGSGLSRDNQISPLQMMQVLDFAYHNDATNYDFISALPIAGVDGTLKHRMQNIRTKVRAKTGTMNGVVALAGYVITKEKEPLAFVIIINGHMGMGWKYKEMENKIMTVLTNYSRG
jgi:D-alanyl-D-alanine carboxypeptidase/D-alanyl-D-alanine-endopeptidase (penicillin-binding protein 4)